MSEARGHSSQSGPYQPGEEVAGRYEVLDLLGRGGAGAVYRVRDRQRQCLLALKVHAPKVGQTSGGGVLVEATWRWRLRREFYLMAQLGHPNIVRVHDWGEDPRGHLYFTMDLIDGCDAADRAPMPVAEVLDVMAALASALGFVHARGFVHQDVKPRNVRLPSRPVAGGASAILMDFGLLAPIGESSFGASRGFVGTPGYVAPELVHGAPADARSDLFSLGVTAYVLLSGSRITKEGSFTDPLPPTVPEPLARLVTDLCAADPSRRPADAAELLERLASLTPAVTRIERTAKETFRQGRAALPLAGRKSELERLRAAFLSAADGKGGAIYVIGEAGLGKTRLIRNFILELRTQGVPVIEARGDARRRTAFGALGSLIWHLLSRPRTTDQLEPDELDLLGRVCAGDPGLGADPDSLAPRVRRAVAHLVEQAASERPLMLVVEDLQFCDAASLVVLEGLGREAQRMPALLLGTARIEPGPAGEERVERLRRGALDVLLLGPLDRAGLLELVRALFGRVELTDELIARLEQASAGNPHLLIEVCQVLVDDGLAVFEAGRWRLPRNLEVASGESAGSLKLPKTLEQALAERVARLAPDARLLAEALAVLAAPADTPLLLTATGLDEPRLFRALDELAAKQLAFSHRGRVALTHGRIGDSLYSALDPVRRQTLHRRIGQLLRMRANEADTTGDVRWLISAIGHHLGRGGPEVEREAVFWLRRAGDAAYAAGNFADAVGPLSEAAEILERHGGVEAEPQLAEIWERLGVAARAYDLELARGAYRKLLAHLDRHGNFSAVPRRARMVGSRLAMLGSLIGAGAARVVQGGVAAARHLVSDVLEEATRYATATGYLGMIEMVLGELDEAKSCARLLESFGQASDEPSALAFGCLARAGWALSVGRFHEVMRLCDHAQDLLDAAADRARAARLQGGRAMRGHLPESEERRARGYLTMLRHWSRVLRGEHDELLTRCLALAGDADDGVLDVQFLALPAGYHAQRGEVTLMLKARSLFLDRCFKVHGSWQEAIVYPTTMPVLVEAGLWAKARDDLRAFETLMPEGPYTAVWRRIFRGILATATGQPAEGLTLCDEAARLSDGGGVHSNLWAAQALARSAEALLALGRLDEADAKVREVLARTRDSELRLPWTEGRVRRVQARTALGRRDFERVAREIAELRALADELDNPGERAQLHLLRAQLAAAQGDHAGAVTLASQAEREFVSLGNGLLAQRAAELAGGRQEPWWSRTVSGMPSGKEPMSRPASARTQSASGEGAAAAGQSVLAGGEATVHEGEHTVSDAESSTVLAKHIPTRPH